MLRLLPARAETNARARSRAPLGADALDRTGRETERLGGTEELGLSVMGSTADGAFPPGHVPFSAAEAGISPMSGTP